ncbi:SsrA-binding protein, partial [bacterium]|nr:SsrA-binding protein [bacterium]
FCIIKDNEVWLKNSYIAKFDIAAMTNHEERRDRKLLLNKQEIKRWSKDLINPGITIVPIKMFINKDNLCKVELALCKGKKEYDKRESIKEKDNKRELDRIKKIY